MADIVYVSTSNSNGQKVISALNKIAQGLSELELLDGLRANSIGTSQAIMAQNFGVSSEAQAQALSDRMASIVAWWNAGSYWMTTAAEVRTILKDTVDATTYAP